MSPRILKPLVTILLVFSVSMPWTLLQSIAWIGMTIDYSAENGIGAAIEKTLSSEIQCQLCEIVEQSAHADDEGSTSLPKNHKLELALQSPAKIYLISSPPVMNGYLKHLSECFNAPLPKPPPRGLLLHS